MHYTEGMAHELRIEITGARLSRRDEKDCTSVRSRMAHRTLLSYGSIVSFWSSVSAMEKLPCSHGYLIPTKLLCPLVLHTQAKIQRTNMPSHCARLSQLRRAIPFRNGQGAYRHWSDLGRLDKVALLGLIPPRKVQRWTNRGALLGGRGFKAPVIANYSHAYLTSTPSQG